MQFAIINISMKKPFLSSFIAVASLVTSKNCDAATSLFDIPSSYWGTHSEAHGNGMVGYVFRLEQAVTVTQLGWYDAQGDGLSRAFQVGLWKSLTGFNFSPASLIGNANTGISIPSGTTAALNGVWRMIDLPSPLMLEPGFYQIGGLDTAATTDPIVYISQNFSYEMLANSNAWVGPFFYSATTSSAPGFHVTDSNHFYLASGLELGPMLFIIPEPPGACLSVVGVGGLLLRRRRKIM